MRMSPQPDVDRRVGVFDAVLALLIGALIVVHIMLVAGWLDFWTYLVTRQFPSMSPAVAEISRRSNLHGVVFLGGASVLWIVLGTYAALLLGRWARVLVLLLGLLIFVFSGVSLGVAHI